MRRLAGFSILLCSPALCAAETLAERSLRYCTELVRIDTTNPPGNETPAAEYVKREMEKEGIPAEVLGGDPSRMNVVARLKGSGAARPLLLVAHTDVVPADPAQWTVPAFSGLVRDGFLYGRGTQDDKCLLAAEMAVTVEWKRRGVAAGRDIILLAESDEEAGSLGIQWMIANAWNRIDAEFGINEGGYAHDTPEGYRLFQIQTAEKIPTRVRLVAKGMAGHGSLPRADNAVLHLSRAVARLADTPQPVRLNTTTRRYLKTVAALNDYRWIEPLLPQLENPATVAAAAVRIRERDPEIDALLRTTVSPTMLEAGMKINVIPNTAAAGIDVRRLPNETRAEVVDRFRRIINDPAVEVVSAGGQEMPATEPSALTTPLYMAIEKVLRASHARTLVVPSMSRGATDSAYLRQKGMALYGAPIFVRVDKESRAHGNDERLQLKSLDDGTRMLFDMVAAVVTAP